MHQRFTSALALLLLVSLGIACTIPRMKKRLTWQIMLDVDAPELDKEAVIKRTVSVIQQRLDAAEINDFQVVPQGSPPNGRVVVSLPEVPDRKRVVELITTVGQLELTAIVSPPSPSPVQTYNTMEEAVASLGGRVTQDRSVLPYAERAPGIAEQNSEATRQWTKWVVIERPAIVDGSGLRNSVASRGSLDDYSIAFSLKPEAAEKFGAWTGAHTNEYLGVVLNGEVRSIAYIKSQISDQGEISGRFTKQAAEDLALILRSGALPAPVKVVGEGAGR
jgi:preprotein translocase subunit SecD